MRVFQFGTGYPQYYADFERRFPAAREATFAERLELLRHDRSLGVHLLAPIDRRDPSAAFTFANDDVLQRAWAKERSFVPKHAVDVLLAQIEEHRSEVVYSLNPVQFPSEFVKRLPACVKKTVCWQASPHPRTDFSAYDVRVCNFPHILETWRQRGERAAYFSPAVDPEALMLADNTNRSIDVCFVGQYSPDHKVRNHLLEEVARLSSQYQVCLALMHAPRRSLLDIRYLRRLTRFLPGLPASLRRVAVPPVFGREMYALLARSRIVINAAVDMSGTFRGNMRCFEAMGCGACMLSDAGEYPPGMRPGVDFAVFSGHAEALASIHRLLGEPDKRQALAQQGTRQLADAFSPDRQWAAFQEIVAAL